MTAVFHGRKKEEIGAGKVSSLLNIRLGKKGYSERWFALGMTAGFVQLEMFFKGSHHNLVSKEKFMRGKSRGLDEFNFNRRLS